jgi:hypothetical protein
MTETKELNSIERRTVKQLRELLVRHGNRCDLLKLDLELVGQFLHETNVRRRAERERKKYWDQLMKADRRLLIIAAEELNGRELR